MALHDAYPQMFYGGVWNDITTVALTSERIETERGYAEEGALRPCRITCVLNNATDTYRPTNPASPLYDGKGGRGMEMCLATDGSMRANAQVSSWKPDQTVDFQVGPPLRGRRWVAVHAEGLLRRIGLWDDPIQSAMRRRLGSLTNLSGYFPLEDGSAAIRLGNTVPGGRAGVHSGISLGGAPGPSGSDPIVKVAAASNMGGSFRANPASGWGISWAMKLNAAPAVARQTIMSWRTGNGMRYEWQADNTPQMWFRVIQGETTLTDTILSMSGLDLTKWAVFRVKATQVAGNVQVEPAFYQQDNANTFGFTFSFAGAVDRLYDWQVNGNTVTADASYAHVYGLYGDTTAMLSNETLTAFNGHVGERTTTRFLRLMSEAGQYASINGTESHGMPMGRQVSDTLIKLLEEIERTEDGLIYDRRDLLEVVLRTRRSRYNQAVALALTYPAHINPPLVESIDDAGVANIVTARQRDGGEQVAQLTTGPMGTSSVGIYRGGFDVNLSDVNLLDDIAAWRLARGTVVAPRYNSLVIDLDANPGLRSATQALEIGDRITLTGREPDPLDMFVLGVHETVETHRYVITLTTRPAGAFSVGVYGAHATASRYDSGSTTLASAATSSAASLALTTAVKADTWSATAVPYDLIVAGERVTCTAMTAPAGTGPYTQTATVTRSVNGVVKAQTATTTVRLFAPARYAL